MQSAKTSFDERAKTSSPDVHADKSKKTLIGITLLILIGAFFYEFSGSAPAPTAPSGAQRMAHSDHR